MMILERLQNILLNNWQDFSSEEKRPKALDFILLTNFNLSPTAKTIIFVVSKPKGKALFLIKISKTKQAEPFLENAHRSLRLLHNDQRVSILKDTFPRSIFADNLDGHFVQIETFARGRDLLSITLKDRKHIRYLLRTKDWLIRFHLSTRETKILDDENIQRYFRNDIDKAKQIFNRNVWLLDFLENFSQRLTNLQGLRLPFVFGHYDFAPKNVKFQGERLKIIDWEHARHPGLPLVDIIHFYLRYYAKLYRRDYLNSFLEVFCQKRNDLLRSGIKEYIEKIAVPEEAIFYLIIQHSILRLVKVIGYRQQLLQFFRQLSSGVISWEGIKL